MRAVVAAAVLMLASFSAAADSADELARAKQEFAQLGSFDAVSINRLQQPRRLAIWARYYAALEQLQRMEIHHRMMRYHDRDRGAQFAGALAAFNVEIKELRQLLPDN